MHRSLPTLFVPLLLSLSAAAAPAPASVPPTATTEDPAADKRPEIATLTATLDEQIAKKGVADTEAVATIDKLFQEFPASGPKDRAAIVKALSKCFEQKRDVKEGEPRNNKLFIASAAAMGQMGPDSTKELIRWIGHKDHRKDPAVQDRLIRSLGQTKDDAAIKTLTNLLDDKDPALVNAAATSLGEFKEKPLETRKTIFEALLKTLMSAKGSTDSDPLNTIFKERYEIILAPIVTTLGALSKHDERDPEEWQRWWNKNKKANWDADN